ncbi:MAG: hypothetical protein KIS92_12175 [Planctomycetota bacterium]|nr:hypothetical protein [Planctomycetota bacterium]
MRGTAILSLLLAIGGWASYVPLSKSPSYRATMWPMFLAVGLALVLAVYAFSKATKPVLATRIVAGLAAVVSLLLVPAYFTMLRVPAETGRPLAGQKMPGVNLVNEYGDKLFTGSFTNNGPLLLVFFRGFW